MLSKDITQSYTYIISLCVWHLWVFQQYSRIILQVDDLLGYNLMQHLYSTHSKQVWIWYLCHTQAGISKWATVLHYKPADPSQLKFCSEEELWTQITLYPHKTDKHIYDTQAGRQRNAHE